MILRGSDPGDAHGIGLKDAPMIRLHGRIPQAGPCSTFRRSLLHAQVHPPWVRSPKGPLFRPWRAPNRPVGSGNRAMSCGNVVCSIARTYSGTSCPE
jgi:hypothetical protein